MKPARKAVTIYGLPEARLSAEVALETHTPIILLSAPVAAAFAGPAWFQSVLAQTRDAVPGVDALGMLDCGDYGGHALAALREGVAAIVYDGAANAAVDDIAAQVNAEVVRRRPECLDTRIAESQGDLATALRAWFGD